MNVTCTRRIQFCAGHRVKGHENKCANLHGHNYVVLITAQAANLDNIGRVIDFSVIKDKIGGWIDRNWDHGFLYWSEDRAAEFAIKAFVDIEGKQKIFVMPDNPTAENMAQYLISQVCPQILAGTGVHVTKVVVWETENCEATAEIK